MAVDNYPFTYKAKGRYWRFRHKLTGDVAIPGNPGDVAFHARYAALVAQVEARQGIKPPAQSTFSWLIAKYRKSQEFKVLSDSTQLDYGRTLDLLEKELGEEPYLHTTRAMIKTVRDDFADTTRKAHKIKQMVSRLYSWADENDHVPEGLNPTKGLKRIKRKGGAREIAVWSDYEIDLFLKHCPAHVLTGFYLLLYTGQRREDVVSMVWTQFQGDTIRVRQSKTKAMLDIACHPVLRTHLESIKRARKGVVIATTASGAAYTPNAFSGALRRAVAATDDMPCNRSSHGLRYAAGSRMEEAGCSVAEIESVLGHETFKMALKYASQRLRAKAALAKLEAANK